VCSRARGPDVQLYLGQLKTLLGGRPLSRRGGVSGHWDVDDVFGLLRWQLGNDGELLVQAIRVIGGNAARDVLDLFEAWTAAPRVGLDVPWSRLVGLPA
jgi:hypothetical protein